MNGRLEGKIAIITGGGTGIGEAIAHKFAKEGARVIVNGLPDDPIEEVAESIRAKGGEAVAHAGDVSDESSAWACIELATTRFGALDVLVNNAGVAPDVRADILDAGEESFDRLIRINLRGPYFLTQAAARWMVEQQQADASFKGVIVNVSSVSATVASVNRGDYCISKAGVAMATQLWAVRLAPEGIVVYEVRPGVVATDMTAGVTEKYDALLAGGLAPMPRWGRPADVGGAVRMLARGEAPYSTGEVFHVDGGMHIARL